jgi:benzoyl-CoA reductase/2-hydroxyglutaryl-CoA dehydratase subunit BcrC/BadD/HgdB
MLFFCVLGEFILKTIGITTTVPIEVLIAAGYKVVDLNNIFISSESYNTYIDFAEREGFPKSSCAWIKGIYGACLANGISEIVGVVEGDCSNTRALMEVLKTKKIKMRSFAYPHSHTKKDVKAAIDSFMEAFNVSLEQVEVVRKRLAGIRKYAKTIDELTYKDNKATGFENHICQVTLSDFDSDVSKCSKMLEEKINEIESRVPGNEAIRLGFIGVPPMLCDIYEYVESLNSRFVYNEVQREFAFPRGDQAPTIYEQYYDYTYPYDLDFRLEEIKKQIKLRGLDGIIHYTQAFCHRAIEDIVIKRELEIPVLTIEGDKLNRLDPRTKLRLEAFLDMLSDLKEVRE